MATAAAPRALYSPPRQDGPALEARIARVPDLASGKVSLQGEARSFEELTKLLRGLEQRTAFRNVFLLRQAKRKAAGATPEGWEFSVSLHYEGRPR